jgi:peptidoglycan/LPS O-acetylase OafA/YrhL
VSDFSKDRNFGLDVVRATAIIMVLISHARQALMEPDTGLALTFGGWFGVELFLCVVWLPDWHHFNKAFQSRSYFY